MAERTFTQLMVRQIRKSKLRTAAAAFVVLLFLVAIFAPLLAPRDPNFQDYMHVLQGPSAQHWLGTDDVGRDILSRVIYGARISVSVGVLAVALGGAIGITVGLLCGYYGGLLDQMVMGVVDVMLAFPGILLAILIAATLGAGFVPVVIAVAIYSVPTFSRLMRGSTLALVNREYVEAARAVGARGLRIIIRVVLVNSFGPVLVYATLLMGSAILTAASLSFLGVGVPPPTPEWGSMVSSAKGYISSAPHLVIGPGVAIFLTILALNILGDAFRDAFDPKS